AAEGAVPRDRSVEAAVRGRGADRHHRDQPGLNTAATPTTSASRTRVHACRASGVPSTVHGSIAKTTPVTRARRTIEELPARAMKLRSRLGRATETAAAS